MSRRFKVKISSFQLCRSKKPPCLQQKQTLASLFSPMNPNAFDISHPRVPGPPPTTPTHHNSMVRIVPISVLGSHDNVYISDTQSELDEETDRSRYGLFNSPASCPGRTKMRKSMKVKAVVSGWLSGEDSDSRYNSMSFGSSYDFSYSLETINEESVTVVKRSLNPYDDFKVSMLEMIMAKEMYGAKDLEQLLQSFLSLNSVHYHGAIIEAFAEVWGEIFGHDRTIELK